jgi:hypothetical protein
MAYDLTKEFEKIDEIYFDPETGAATITWGADVSLVSPLENEGVWTEFLVAYKNGLLSNEVKGKLRDMLPIYDLSTLPNP